MRGFFLSALDTTGNSAKEKNTSERLVAQALSSCKEDGVFSNLDLGDHHFDNDDQEVVF